MNSRITIISDTEVQIDVDGCASCFAELSIDSDRSLKVKQSPGGNWWYDSEARLALRDCINCLEATGSFAALADTSAVPYQNKMVRALTFDEDDGTIFKVLNINGDNVNLEYPMRIGDGMFSIRSVDVSKLRPLTAPEPPAPKFRPLTPVEAAAHLGRTFIYSEEARVLDSVSKHEIIPFNGRPPMSFECFAKHCIWADDSTPCGVPTNTTNER